RMIGRAVAFDSEQGAPRAIRIDDGQVDDEAGRTDLGLDLVAEVFQSPGHLALEVRVMIPTRTLLVVQYAGGRIAQERLEDRSPARPGSLQVDVVGLDRAEDFTPLAGARDQDIQAAFAAFDREGPEIHGDIAGRVAGVSDGDEDDVALVPLDVFEVLDEEGL